jgi:hypothetical protein
VNMKINEPAGGKRFGEDRSLEDVIGAINQ